MHLEDRGSLWIEGMDKLRKQILPWSFQKEQSHTSGETVDRVCAQNAQGPAVERGRKKKEGKKRKAGMEGGRTLLIRDCSSTRPTPMSASQSCGLGNGITLSHHVYGSLLQYQ